MRLLLCSALVMLSFGLVPASADQITFGPSTNNISFCSLSGGAVTVSAAGFSSGCVPLAGTGTITGSATWNPTGGSAELGTFSIAMSTMTLTPAGGAVWNSSGGAGSTFTYSGASGTIVGSITWSTVTDATNPIQFAGSLQITSASGSLLARFPVGTTVGFDFTMNGGAGILTALSAAPGQSSNPISSGEVAPVPEPGSILLLGSGLLAAGSFLRMRRKRIS